MKKSATGTLSAAATSASYSPKRTANSEEWAMQSHNAVSHFHDGPRIHYDVSDDKLGAGTFGTTRVGRHKESGQQHAIKAVPKALMSEQVDIWREIQVMYGLEHPNIVKLYSTYEDMQHTYLVMELCSGGELFDAIVESKEGLSENVAAKLLRQMLAAVSYLHGHKICHRDLKPENFLMSENRSSAYGEKIVKLIDFGSAKSFVHGEELITKVFTIHYVAPEILTRKEMPYTEVCDVWSLGVILYLLLAGRPPFSGEDDMTIMKAIKKGKYSMQPESVWCDVSADAIELITGMLEVQPSKRYTAEMCYHDGWIIAAESRLLCDRGGHEVNEAVRGGLRSFMLQNKLKKFALQAIAQNISDEHIESLRVLFQAIDKDTWGVLDSGLIEDAVKGLHLDSATEADLKEVLDGMTHDGMVHYTQFIDACVDRKRYKQEAALKEVYDCFGVDGDGSISKEELVSFLGGARRPSNLMRAASGAVSLDDQARRRLSVEATELDALLQGLSKDGNGSIDFEEFVTMMTRSDANG